MPDREKVIKGLECCSNCDESGCLCKECPYGTNEYDTCDTIDHLLKDALKVLKEQEPAKPREERHEVKINHEWGDEVEAWSEFYCPHCGKTIASGESKRYPRCMWCGKAVKWG